MNDKVTLTLDSEYLTAREREHEIIKAGKLPTIAQLYAGSPFFGGRVDLDVQAWADDWLANRRIQEILVSDTSAKRSADIRDAVQRLRNVCSYDAMVDAWRALDGVETTAAARVDVYLACSGDVAARHRVGRAIHERGSIWRAQPMDLLLRSATARGLQQSEREMMQAYCSDGLDELRQTRGLLDRFDVATAAVEQAEAADADAAKTELMLAVMGEDRAEIEDAWAPGLIVVPTLPDGTTSWRREIYKGWRDHAGQRMPLVQRGDVAQQRRALVGRWPHAEEIVDTILGDLAARSHLWFRPTLLVGEPGSGKSSLARAICETVGLPVELHSLAGVHDASLMGTSAQWSSARESVVLQLIKRSGKASVAAIWDEIEKIGTRRDNGFALDALLPMLELDQARRYRDLALEIEVDLSAVSHFATANSLDGVPAPLRDRMRVLTMPNPGWQHLGVLTRQIVDRLARERGIDPRWFQPLAEDEMDLVRAAWPGGSIRQLTRIVVTILDGREQIMGRA